MPLLSQQHMPHAEGKPSRRPSCLPLVLHFVSKGHVTAHSHYLHIKLFFVSWTILVCTCRIIHRHHCDPGFGLFFFLTFYGPYYR